MREDHTLDTFGATPDTGAQTSPTERDAREHLAASEPAGVTDLSQFRNAFGLSFRVRRQVRVGREWIVVRYGRAYVLRRETNGEFHASLSGHDVSLRGVGDTAEQALEACDDNMRWADRLDWALGANDAIHPKECSCVVCARARESAGMLATAIREVVAIARGQQPANPPDPG